MGKDVRGIVLKLIKEHLGTTTANLYSTFYADKGEATIVQSAHALFTELFGEKRAKEILGAELNGAFVEHYV